MTLVYFDSSALVKLVIGEAGPFDHLDHGLVATLGPGLSLRPVAAPDNQIGRLVEQPAAMPQPLIAVGTDEHRAGLGLDGEMS